MLGPRRRRRRLRRRGRAGARRARARRSMIRGVELDVGAHVGDRLPPRARRPPSTRCCATPTSRSGTRRPARREVVVYSERLRRARGGAADARGRAQPRDRRRRARARLPAAGRARRRPAARRSRRSCAGRTPSAGLLSPEEFIEPAEQTGVIRPLTMWVVREALDQAERWRADGLDLRVAVNLSVRSITPELPRELAPILDGRRGALELEITETVGMERRRGLARRARAADRRSGSGSRSTTSAPASPRWPTSSGCRSARSRSTARS